MDYDTIINKIGGFGRYQKIVLTLLSIAPIFNALTTFAATFTFGEHKHWCQASGYNSTEDHVVINGSEGKDEVNMYNVSDCFAYVNGSLTKCHSWVYDHSIYTGTIISKFDVVCDSKFNRAHFLMSHYLGLLVGSVVTGFLSDTFGRKPLMWFGILTLVLATGIRPLIPSLTMVTIIEFFNGLGSVVYYIVPYVLATEMVGPDARLFASFCIYFTFCIGSYALLLYAYLIRNWEHLMWAISFTTSGYIIILLFLSESPRWLLSRGKKKEAVDILEKIAKANGGNIILSDDDIIVTNETNASFLQFLKELVKTKILLVRLCILALNWFSLSLTYYGISMNVSKLSGNIFTNFAIASSVETVACFVCLIGPDRFGRKKFFCSTMILGGVTCFCTIFTSLYAEESLSWITTTLAMFAKFFITIAFFFAYLITAELFPTVLRVSVIGVCSMTGRLGAITSAYIGELGSIIPSQFGKALPLIIFGAVGLVAGLLALTLPETVNLSLPESVDDAKILPNNPSDIMRQEHELQSMKNAT